MRPESAPLPSATLEAAADWLLQLHDAPDDTQVQSACQRWCEQHPDHARAWQRAQQLQSLLLQVPPALALPVLGRGPDPRRRTALKTLGLWLGVLPAGWVGWQLLAPAPAGPSLRTAVGERRTQALPDGSTLLLDTDTQVSVHYSGSERGLWLERGRIRVTSTADPQSPARPLQVHTSHGRVRAVGTRFDVRQDENRTQVSLFEGRLLISPDNAAPQMLEAGQQAWFDALGGFAATPEDGTGGAWAMDMLVADNQPLGELLAELARYRRGVLRCDPAVARLPVSGAFPLDDTERSLALLEATYPVRVQRAGGGWWTTVGAR